MFLQQGLLRKARNEEKVRYSYPRLKTKAWLRGEAGVAESNLHPSHQSRPIIS